MAFIQPCFIRKNTLELRRKLEELGYIICGTLVITNVSEIICYDNIAYGCEYPWEYRQKAIDCGTNEELFLALAALRDNTDKYQWFFSSGWTDFEGNSLPDKWILCDQDTLEKFAFVNNSPNSYKTGWKKANVKELIEHFKSI